MMKLMHKMRLKVSRTVASISQTMKTVSTFSSAYHVSSISSSLVLINQPYTVTPTFSSTMTTRKATWQNPTQLSALGEFKHFSAQRRGMALKSPQQQRTGNSSSAQPCTQITIAIAMLTKMHTNCIRSQLYI